MIRLRPAGQSRAGAAHERGVYLTWVPLAESLLSQPETPEKTA
jgi:hypothetical protein